MLLSGNIASYPLHHLQVNGIDANVRALQEMRIGTQDSHRLDSWVNEANLQHAMGPLVQHDVMGRAHHGGVGFILEKQDDGQWNVLQAPRLLDGDEVEPFLLDLLQDMSEDGAPLETIERRKDHLSFLNACRGAVKANDTLTIAQMRRLLEDMRNVPNPWACVHGRPTALRLSLNSLDKHFGRHG